MNLNDGFKSMLVLFAVVVCAEVVCVCVAGAAIEPNLISRTTHTCA